MSKDKGKMVKEKEENRSYFEDYYGLGKCFVEVVVEEIFGEDKKESKKKKGKEEKEKLVFKVKFYLYLLK